MLKRSLPYVEIVAIVVGLVLLNFEKPPTQLIGLLITVAAMLHPAISFIVDTVRKPMVDRSPAAETVATAPDEDSSDENKMIERVFGYAGKRVEFELSECFYAAHESMPIHEKSNTYLRGADLRGAKFVYLEENEEKRVGKTKRALEAAGLMK